MFTARLRRKLSTCSTDVLQLYYRVVEVPNQRQEEHNLDNVHGRVYQINKYREQIHGTLSGFDRLVFRGSLRRLQYGRWDRDLQPMVAQGMEQYLCSNHILFKDYWEYVKGVSQKVKQASVKPFENQGLPVQFLRNPAADKEEIARAITAGLPCWRDSCDSHAIRGKDRAAAQVWDDLMQQARGEKSTGVN
jgi:hypothetical protein